MPIQTLAVTLHCDFKASVNVVEPLKINDMKVWLTLEKTRFGDRVMLWFDKPQKVYDRFIERERWTSGEGASFYYPLLSLEDVNYLVTEENSPLEIDLPFMRRFVVDESKSISQKIS